MKAKFRIEGKIRKGVIRVITGKTVSSDKTNLLELVGGFISELSEDDRYADLSTNLKITCRVIPEKSK